MQRKLYILMAVCFLALLLCLGARLGDQTASGTLIPAALLEAKMAGGCGNTKCVTDSCLTTNCTYTSTTCSIQGQAGNQYCGEIESNPGELCNTPIGSDPGWNCSQSNRSHLCVEYYEADLNDQLNCNGVACTGSQGILRFPVPQLHGEGLRDVMMSSMPLKNL